MERFIPLLLPPLIGALIGYITNRIAIGMLFRPYREKRLLGLRIPFTPGIIPRQRYRLSGSIGRMVSTHLFTEEAVRKQLSSPDFGDRFEKSVREGLNHFLDHPFEPSLRDSAMWAAVSPLLGKGVGEAVLELCWNKPLDELLPLDFGKDDLLSSLAEKADQRLSSERGTLGSFLSYRSVILISELFDSRYADLVGALDMFLHRPTIRRQLEQHGRAFLADVIGRLSSVQRLMLMAGQYDRTLHERMPEIIQDGLKQLHQGLESSDVKKKIVQWLRVSLLRARQIPVFRLYTSLHGTGSASDGSLVIVLNELFSSLRKQSLAALATWIGLGSPKAVVEFFSRGTDKDERGVLSRLLSENPPARFISLDSSGRDNLARLITGEIVSFLQKHAAVLLEHIDVNALVVQRIDELEIEQVEDLLLVVIATHLKYINLFGALLGGIIGALQLLM